MSFSVEYTWVERLVHNAAFAGIGLQKNVAEIEDMMFASQLTDVQPGPPVFISSLPRAGTTLLLESLCAGEEFATHTYREMPFLFCPLLWAQISGGFRKEATRRERAHGDGMLVGYDSPEAFEEVFWRAYWPQHYKADRIVVWSGDEVDPREEFEAFFRSHMRKLIALRRIQGAGNASRYVSKNNGNIARFAKIMDIAPDATILTPFRAPLAHAQSLWRQHLNFSELHATDKFARSYMDSVAHLDFGANLKPIDFGGWLEDAPDPSTFDFWLRYWIAAFEHVLAEHAASVQLVSYERLCATPGPGLARLAQAAGAAQPDLVEAQAVNYQVRTSATDAQADPQLLRRAEAVHDALLHASIV